MKLKLYTYCPDDEEVISRVIHAASEAGAGNIGNYSQCAFITKGSGNWKSEKGAHPAIGSVGQTSRIPEVKIEMECPENLARHVEDAIRMVHPYESAVIEFVPLFEQK